MIGGNATFAISEDHLGLRDIYVYGGPRQLKIWIEHRFSYSSIPLCSPHYSLAIL